VAATQQFDPLAVLDEARKTLVKLEGKLSDLEGEVQLYTLTQVTRILGISRTTLLLFKDEGKIKITHRLGPKSLRISHAEVKRFLGSCEVRERIPA